MKLIAVTLVALTLLGVGVTLAPGAEAATECQTSSPPPVCPVGAIPWWNGHHGCGGEMWTCVYIIAW